MYTKVNKLASFIHNNIVGGLSGMHSGFSVSTEQLEDAVVNERVAILNEYTIKGVPIPKDLYISINCIPIDCDTSLESCSCGNSSSDCDEFPPHFEIPQLLNGVHSISYLGSTDRMVPFIITNSPQSLKYRKYRKRGKDKPYVLISMTPNKNGMYDCFLFNAPLLDKVSITAIFKDTRQLQNFKCCVDDNTISALDAEVIDRVTKKMLLYYRSYYMHPRPNDQSYTPGQ